MSESAVEPAKSPARKSASLWSALLGGAVGFTIVWLMSPHTDALESPSSSAPPGAVRIALLALLLSIYLCGVGAYVRRKARSSTTADVARARPPLRRSAIKRPGRSILIWNLLMCVWLFVMSEDTHWTYETVGFVSAWPPMVSLAVGAAAYAALVLVLSAGAHLLDLDERLNDHHLQNMARLWPRRRSDKIMAFVAVCLLNPIVEELIFRGLLVYQLGLALDSPVVPVVLGLVISLANHAYQGWLSTTTHLPFYFVAVALLYSPAGLWGAMGLHFGGDLFPVLSMRSRLRSYHERNRRLEVSSSLAEAFP